MASTLRRSLQQPASAFDLEERLSLIAATPFFGTWDRNLVTGAVWCSLALKSMLGYGEDDFPKTSEGIVELVHPEDREPRRLALERHWRDHTPFDFEYRLQHKTDGYRWFRVTGQTIWGPDGRPRRMGGALIDITERRQAEVSAEVTLAALQSSESQFRSIVAHIPGACFRILADDSWTPIFLSDGIEKITGRPPRDFQGAGLRYVDILVHPDDIPALVGATRAALKERRPFAFEYRVNHTDGRVRWAHEEGQGVFDEKGNLLYTDGVILDVTERRQAENDLRESEAKFASLVANIPGACYRCRTDENLTMLYASERMQEITGYKPSDLELNKIVSFSSIIHREDWPAAKKAIWQAIERRESFAVEYRVMRADGGIRWISDRGQGVFGEDGTLVYQDGVLLDITERKLQEERLRTAEAETAERYAKLQCIIDNMADGVALFDSEMRLAAFNQEMVAMGELPPVFAHLGTLYEDLIRAFIVKGDYGPGDVDAMLAEKMAQARSGKPAVYEIARHDGRYIEVRRQPMPDGGAVFTYRDVTQHRTIETQLRESQKLEALGQLAGGIAHEFNNLLTAIGGFSRLALKKRDDTERVAMCLDEVVKASERAADLTKQLLAFGRKQVLETSVVEIPAIVGDLVGMLRPLLGETIELVVRADVEDACVVADATKLSQAILNLAINGRDAMPDGGRLIISVEVVEHAAPCRRRESECGADTCVLLQVSDTGTGIDPETLPRIFEPFFTTKEQGKGTGLGLAVVYGMVDQLGGTIDVQSELGKGTTFTICLPQADRGADAAVAEPEAPAAERPKTVLVVDDEAAVCNFARIALLDLGYKVVTASSAVDAVAVFNELGGAVDILLTDVVMPGQCGPDLARGLAEMNPDLEVIFMSGYPERGANDSQFHRIPEGSPFIHKPFSPDAIGTLVGTVAASQSDAVPAAASS